RSGRRGPEHHPRRRVFGRAAAGARCLLGPGALAVIEFQDLRKAFDGRPVLDGFTLRVPDGETTVIMGYSGMVKSVALKHVVDLTGAEERYPAELSGGMRKRVGIARAIALRPRYILYDEPTTGLDPVTSAVIDQLMMRTREHLRVTGIVVTHDMRSAYTVGDRIAMLYEGKIRQVGTVAQIQETEDPVVRQFIEGRPA